MPFATGKHAYGISDRSGFRYKLNDMRKEWTGALVGPDEWESKSPQISPRPVRTDPQAVRNPRPDRVEPLKVYVWVPVVESNLSAGPHMTGKVGQVTVVTP